MASCELNRKIIDKNIYIPYGLEFEMEGVPFDDAKRVIRHKVQADWKIGSDRSLDNGGIEIASPVLENSKDSIIRLKKLASTLKFLGVTFEHASLQLNFDFFNRNSDDIIYLMKVFSVYQNVIYRFSTGLDASLRTSAFDNAVPLGQLFRDKLRMNAIKEESYKRFINNKSFSLSLKTLTKKNQDPIKVVEFRTPNGSSNFYLWMNYIVFFSSFLMSVNKHKFDEGSINDAFNRMEFADSIEELLSIEEEKAMELANIIYASEAEKNNFYDQYFDKVVKTR